MSCNIIRSLNVTNKIYRQLFHNRVLNRFTVNRPLYPNNAFWNLYYTGSKYDAESQLATAGTVQQLKQELAAWMGVESGYKPLGAITESRSYLLDYLPTNQNDLPQRTMDDSFASALIPLSTDLELQDKYISFLGHVRVGRLLEDMDIFAVYVAQKHILNPKQPQGKHSPYTLVTALVDEIDFTDYLPKPNDDIRLSGHVSWVGKSSMEVVVWLEQKSHGVWRKLTRALFLIAARDPLAQKSAMINSLIATTTEEKEILAGGEARKKQRMYYRQMGTTYRKDDPIHVAGTMENVADKLAKIMGIDLNNYDPNQTDPHARDYLIQYLPKDQKELPPRTMANSFASAIVPLSSDLRLRDRYTAFMGHVRTGRLLEDMDTFAAYISHLYISNPKVPKNEPTPYTIVTILVDRIDFAVFTTKHNEDIRLLGNVSWVGKSSLEVIVWLEQNSSGSWVKLTKAVFLMAARDPTLKAPAIINPLVQTSDEEGKIIAAGELRKKNRKVGYDQQLTKVIPTSAEQELMHTCFLRTLDINEASLIKQKLPHNCQWMETCRMSHLVTSHPEHRNLHDHVFGGFMMRVALELSYGLGYFFSKHRPILRSISDISFKKPVEINALIHMHSHVTYTEKTRYQITVYADAWDFRAAENYTSNTFHFTYESPEYVPEVFPKTYQEAMLFIDGYRHLRASLNSSVFKK